jgi:hypothetical protein
MVVLGQTFLDGPCTFSNVYIMAKTSAGCPCSAAGILDVFLSIARSASTGISNYEIKAVSNHTLPSSHFASQMAKKL